MARATATRPRTAPSSSAKPKPAGPRIKTLVTNRQAPHEYHILETVEAGLALQGTEVKSIRAGNVNLRDAYARAENGEIWLWNAHIAPFDQGNRWNHEPRRPRKLLLHTREIGRLASKATESGNTLVPLRLYEKNGKIKLELALGKGKRQYDKRVAIAERENKREIERAIKEAYAR
jgi:SsrA-binding protein